MIISRLIEKIASLGFSETCQFIFGYIRGLFYRLWLGNSTFFQVRGKLRIDSRFAQIIIGNKVKFYPNVKLSALGRKNKFAKIDIGEGSSIGDRTEIHAGTSVCIGKRVFVSWDCVIIDRDYHGIFGLPEVQRPIIIGDDVLIGCNSIILKGVSIGKGAVIGAGSVVTKSVPNGVLVAGNPARILKHKNLSESENA